jgi:murein DD-endopeptidase MepM/ murein hydrolase activator NlpD
MKKNLKLINNFGVSLFKKTKSFLTVRIFISLFGMLCFLLMLGSFDIINRSLGQITTLSEENVKMSVALEASGGASLEKTDKAKVEYYQKKVMNGLKNNNLNRYVWSFKKFDVGYPVYNPSESIVTSEYGWRFIKSMPKLGIHFHAGIDIIPVYDFRVLCVYDGIVEDVVSDDPFFGNYIVITHVINDIMYRTAYTHLSASFVEKGHPVKKGEEIGLIGSTGQVSAYHLHFAMYRWDIKRQCWITINPVATTTHKKPIDFSERIRKNDML